MFIKNSVFFRKHLNADNKVKIITGISYLSFYDSYKSCGIKSSCTEIITEIVNLGFRIYLCNIKKYKSKDNYHTYSRFRME